jgi:AcrR family transcriptional regulator
MARPANADAAETRQRLLDAALRLFARDGFHGASTRELAALAGVNVATLNYYYRSKLGLYDACVDEVYRRLAQRGAAMLDGVDIGDLEALLDRAYAAARAERDGVRVLVRQILDHGRLTARTEARHFLPELDKLARVAARLFGCTPARARSAAVALSYLVSRYVIQDDGSLMAAFAVREPAHAHQRVVATLAATARALLGPESKDRN